jgi:hypothetical protein
MTAIRNRMREDGIAVKDINNRILKELLIMDDWRAKAVQMALPLLK